MAHVIRPLLFCLVMAFYADAAPPPIEKDGYKLDWTAVSWQGDVNLPGGRKSWEASLSGTLSAPRDKDIVAFVIEMEEVTDAKGRSMLPTAYEQRWSQERRQKRRDQQVHRVAGRRNEEGIVGAFEIALGGGDSSSSKIAKARGNVYVMEVTTSKTLALPLDSGRREWVQLAEGAKFRVEKTEVRGNQTIVTISHTLDEDAVGGENLTQAPYIYGAQALGEDGKELPGVNTGFSVRGDNQVMVNIFSQNNQTLKPAALGLRVAMAVRERKIPFELTDVDLGVGKQKEGQGGKDPKKKAEGAK